MRIFGPYTSRKSESNSIFWENVFNILTLLFAGIFIVFIMFLFLWLLKFAQNWGW